MGRDRDETASFAATGASFVTPREVFAPLHSAPAPGLPAAPPLENIPGMARNRPDASTTRAPPPLDVGATLATIGTEGTFATELSCPAEDLRLEVDDVGPIRFPIPAATLRKLAAVARPAPFGRGIKTLHDRRVRDTLEIAASRIAIDEAAWAPALQRELAVLASRLGLPPGSQLEAELDKLLIYGPGQFFAPHQDSERADAMVASLVVVLPCPHQGGAVVVEHGGMTKTLRGAPESEDDLALLAFFADCRHEVRPVLSGHRVALAYHLLQRNRPRTRKKGGGVVVDPLAAVDRLTASIEHYFATPRPEPYSRSPPARPDRLIVLLDHEYTERSLGWGRLKGADRVRVDALRAVAVRLEGEVHLALADVHESWSCEEEDWGYGRRRGRWHRYEEDAEDASDLATDAGEHELLELIDTEIALHHWIDARGRASRLPADSAGMDEVSFTRASTEMKPFRSEHEGNMGNYGNTVDRWYHRAALVYWPRARDFAVRARISPSWAVDAMAAQVAAGASRGVGSMARELLPFWSGPAAAEGSADLVGRLLGVLEAIDDADVVLQLLAPLVPRWLTSATIEPLAALIERHGVAWGQQLVTSHAGRATERSSWLALLPATCAGLAGAGARGREMASWLLAREVSAFEARHADWLRLPAAHREPDAGGHLEDALALLEAAAAIASAPARDRVVSLLTTSPSAPPARMVATLLQLCVDARQPKLVKKLGARPLVDSAVARLEEALATAPRAKDDWSIDPPTRCSCELCKTLGEFLRDRGQAKLAWPLAQMGRQHVHRVIDSEALPVTHVTTRRGSPYTLVLTKLPVLAERDAARRSAEREALSWLRKARGRF